MNNSPQVDVQVDARHLPCPMPLLKAKQALNRMQTGQVLQILATDAGSWRDFHVFVQQCHHQLLLAEENELQFCYRIQKGQKPAEGVMA